MQICTVCVCMHRLMTMCVHVCVCMYNVYIYVYVYAKCMCIDMLFQLKGAMTAAGWHGLGCNCSRFIVLQGGRTCVALTGDWLLSFCFYVYTYSSFSKFCYLFLFNIWDCFMQG